MKTFNEIVYDSGVMPILFSEPDCAETVIKAIEQTETNVNICRGRRPRRPV